MSDSPAMPVAAGPDQLAGVVRDALAERYAAPVLRMEGDQVQVPAGKPLAIARAAAAAAGLTDVEQRVVAIDTATLAWWSVPREGLRLWRQHGKGEGAPGAELVTELQRGDPPVQVVGELHEWQLIRCVDGATGWLSGWSNIEHAPAFEPAKDPGDAIATATIDPDSFAQEVTRFLGVPYVWGGTSHEGVDCSGLVQRSAWTVGRRWLPRHSSALLRAGERVAIGDLARGDVLVLRRDVATIDPDRVAQREAEGRPLHTMHVAVAVEPDTVVHASRDAWQVVSEPLADIRARFDVLGVRRLSETPRS